MNAQSRPGRARGLINLGAAVLLLVGLTLYARSYDLSIEALRAQTAAVGPLRMFALLALLYGLISVAPIPGRDVLKIAAAVLLGWAGSTGAIWLGEMLAAAAGFGLARYGGRPAAAWLLGRQVELLDDLALKFSPWGVFVARIVPFTPYRYFNLACGLSAMPFGNYLVGSLPGVLLRTAAFQYLFALGGDWLVSDKVGLPLVFGVTLAFAVVLVSGWGLWMRARARKAAGRGAK